MAQLQISENLSQWLGLSWFYPEGFKKREIEHNSRSCTVIGDSLSYRFQKHENTTSIFEKLDGCRRELQLNRELAPDVYLGAKLLKWVDDEPHWFTQEFTGSELSAAIAKDAEEVGLVLRTVPSRGLLSYQLKTESFIEPRVLPKLVRVLGDFYQRRKREGIRTFLTEPDECVAKLQSKYIRKLEALRCDPRFGDFYNVTLGYCQGRLLSEFYRVSHLLHRRGEAGKIVEIHNNLRCDNICIEPLCQGGKDINIIGRFQRILGDELEDLAQLYVDFISLGYRGYAEQLKQLWVNTQDADELYLFRLLVAVESFVRIHNALHGTEDIEVEIRSLISNGFLSTVGGDQALVISLEKDAVRYNVMLAAFLDCPTIVAAQEDEFISNFWVRQDQRFLKSLQHIEDAVSQGANVVLQESIATMEQRVTLARRLEELGARLIFVQADETRAVVHEEVFGFRNAVSNGLESTEHWNLSKKELESEEAWRLVADFLIRALTKKQVKTAR